MGERVEALRRGIWVPACTLIPSVHPGVIRSGRNELPCVRKSRDHR